MTASNAGLSLQVVQLTEPDTRLTARLHREYLPHGLFPRLGERFMRRWQRTFVQSEHGVALGVRDQTGTLHGFLLATTDQAAYSAETLRRWGKPLALEGAVALLARPRVLVDFLRTRGGRYARRLIGRRPGAGVSEPAGAASASPSATVGTPATVGVLHALVCVPDSRGLGVGAALTAELDRIARERGTPLLQLVTRAEGGAAAFYEKQGWQVSDRRNNRDGHAVVQLDRRLADR